MEAGLSRDAVIKARIRVLMNDKAYWAELQGEARCQKQERRVKDCATMIKACQEEIDALVDELEALEKFATKFDWDLERDVMFVEEDNGD